MIKKPVYITEYDMQRLLKLLNGTQHCPQESPDLELLFEEMERAVVVPSERLSKAVVTLNTRMRVKDLDSSEEAFIQLVFPNDADFEHGKISIFTPMGAALIGYSEGDVAEWRISAGSRRLLIEEITYQPESDGLY